MPRAALPTLLVVFVLFAGRVEAQRGGGTFHGGIPGIGIGGHVGVRNGMVSVHPHFRQPHNFGSGGLFPGFWYGDAIDYEQPSQPVVVTPAPPVIIVQGDNKQQETSEARVATPKIIEVPETTGASAPRPELPTTFILTNGQRLESRRYVLTADDLRVTINYQQRIIPLSMLDLDATLAANREHGIELRIPADRNEVSLSF